jgi:hypothetical protein
MMNKFIVEDIESNDIDNQYALQVNSNGLSSVNNNSFVVYNLITIDGVNELQLENIESNWLSVVGYTPVTNVTPDSRLYGFVNEDNLPYVDVITEPEDPTLFRIPDNCIIQRITCINIKGGPIPPDISEKCKIFTVKFADPDSLTYIIGTETEGDNFDIFNNLKYGNTTFSIVPDSTSLFIFTMRIPESANDFFKIYQLKFTVYYTLT